MGVKTVLKVAESNREKPTITFTVKELPELKNWKVGKKYKLTIDVEQVGINKDEWEKETTGRFKVLKVVPHNTEDDE